MEPRGKLVNGKSVGEGLRVAHTDPASPRALNLRMTEA